MIGSLMQRVIASFLLVAVVGGLAFASIARADDATPDAHAGHHAAASPTRTDSCTTPMSETPTLGGGMVGSPLAGMDMSHEFDLLFIDMMTVHHQSAIAIARVALERGEHQEVLDLAQAIITTQQAEIDQMAAWRNAWYPGASSMPMDQMGQMMEGMMQGMPEMTGSPGTGMSDMGGMMGMMDPQSDVRALCAASGPFDQTFLQMLTPHHQSAVMMARVALVQAMHSEITQLAQAIIDGQQLEIAEMQTWLSAWYGSGTPAAG